MIYYSGHPEYLKDATKPTPSRNVAALVYGCMDIAANWDKTTLADMPASYRKERLNLTQNILECCFEQEISFFDHADIYGRGKSEEIFALAISEMGISREQYILQSKAGIVLPDHVGDSAYYNFDASYIVQQVEASLRRLNTDYLDILLLHRPDALVEPDEVAKALVQLQQQGKVRAFGVSNHSAAQIALLQERLPFQLAYNQMEISLLHHELLSAGLEYNTANPVRPYFDTADYCQLKGIRLQAWAPVARGKVFRPSDANQQENPKQKSLAAELEAMAQTKNCSPSALAIAWLLRHPAEIQPIIGTTKVERIKEYCQAFAVSLSKVEWYRLLVAAREKNLP